VRGPSDIMEPAELVEEQRKNVIAFGETELQREQSEKIEGERLAATSAAARNQARAATSEAKDYGEEAHRSQAAAYEALKQAGLSAPQPRFLEKAEEGGHSLSLLKIAVNQVNAAADQIAAGALALTETRKQVRIRLSILGIGAGVLVMVLVIIHLLSAQTQRNSRVDRALYQGSRPAAATPSQSYTPAPTHSYTPPTQSSRFQVGREWSLDWHSQYAYRGVMRIRQHLGVNRFMTRITVNFVNEKGRQISVSMDGLLTIQGSNVVINCSNANKSWWDTDDFYLQWNNDTMTGYNIDKKGRRGNAMFRFVG
jgi:hypothetical protein